MNEVPRLNSIKITLEAERLSPRPISNGMKKSAVSTILPTLLFFSCFVFAVPVFAITAVPESIALSSSTPPLPGCASSYGFSIVSGLPCSDGTFYIMVAGATATSGALTKPALVPGCAGTYGFSIHTGQPCSVKVANPNASVPGAGVYLGGWQGWVNPKAATTTKTAKIHFARPLDVGSRGDDVRLLQSFLAKDKELYPEGYVNGYFGKNTARAVGRLQIKYGLVKSSAESTYGFVGPRTRILLNSLQ